MVLFVIAFYPEYPVGYFLLVVQDIMIRAHVDQVWILNKKIIGGLLIEHSIGQADLSAIIKPVGEADAGSEREIFE